MTIPTVFDELECATAEPGPVEFTTRKSKINVYNT